MSTSTKHKMALPLSIYLGTISVLLIDNVVTDPQKLTATSNPRIAEMLYRRLRDEKMDLEPPPVIDPNTKNRICHHITGTSYFANELGQAQVNIPKVGPTLKEAIPSIYSKLYEPSSADEASDVYANRTRFVDVYPSELAKETIKEYVFVCLTYEDDDEEPKFYVYSVSGEYNLSDNPTNSHLVGRFLFIYTDPWEDELDLFGVAEVPARSLLTPGVEVELEYVRSRQGCETEADPEDDPICELSRSERLRVCTLIMSSTYFERELEFTPEYEYVDRSRCVKRTITFQHEKASKKAGRKLYQEWTIACRPEEYYADFQAEYYVSRVHNSDTKAFVYRRSEPDSRIILENLFDDVRFLI